VIGTCASLLPVPRPDQAEHHASSKPKKGSGKPIESKPVEKPEPEPSSPAGAKNTERW